MKKQTLRMQSLFAMSVISPYGTSCHLPHQREAKWDEKFSIAGLIDGLVIESLC